MKTDQLIRYLLQIDQNLDIGGIDIKGQNITIDCYIKPPTPVNYIKTDIIITSGGDICLSQ